MKRKLWMILALVAALALLGCGAALADQSGTCGTNLTWTLNDSTHKLTISGTGSMTDYTRGGTPWYETRDSIRSLKVNDGITEIGNYAFYGCSDLTSATIPVSIQRIGVSAFNGCYYLVQFEITNPDAVIENNAFSGCSNLTLYGWTPSTTQTYAAENNIPFESIGSLSGPCGDNVTYSFDPASGTLTISGKGPMTNYSSESARPWDSYKNDITSVYIGSGVTHIGKTAFSSCKNVTSVTIPDSVTSIDEYAFSYCISLVDIILPDSVTRIGFRAFFYCTALTSIALPESLTSLGMGTFEYCSGLTSVTIPDSANSFSISNSAFFGCSSLASVTIPDRVTSIDGTAFAGCISLTSVSIGNSVTEIGERAFESCKNLTSITFPQSVKNIRDWAFNSCEKLSHAIFYGKYFSIGEYVFDSALYTGTIHGLADSTAQALAEESHVRFELLGSYSGSCGKNVTWTFDPASGVLMISGTGAMTDYTEYTDVPWRSHRYAVRSVIIENGVTSLGDYAFLLESVSLTSVTIPGSVTRIGRSAFASCTGLRHITIPDSVTSIGEWVLYNCSSLTYATVYNANVSIGTHTFEGCPSLTLHGRTPSTVQTYANANSIPFVPLTEKATPDFTLPAAMTRIGDEAFSGAKMTVVYIPDGVTVLASKAFANCTSLIQIRIPASVVAIAPDVFYGLTETQLHSITVFGTPGSAAETYANSKGMKFSAE